MAYNNGDYIYIGSVSAPSFSFDVDEIYDVNIDTSVDVIGMEARADTMEVEVEFDDEDDDLKNLKWATPVFYFSGEEMVGKFYSKKVIRTGRTKYRIECTSALGILDYEKFYGGIYSRQKFSILVQDILWTNGISPYNQVFDEVHRYQKDSTHDVLAANFRADRSGGMDVGTTKLIAEFTLNESLLNDARHQSMYSGVTSLRLYLLGGVAVPNAPVAAVKKQYGVYMDISRSSANADWPDFGEVFFVYSDNYPISLGTPTGSTKYSLDIDPNEQLAVINGTNYLIVPPATSIQEYVAPLMYYGGGVALSDYTTETRTDIGYDVTYGIHQVYVLDSESSEMKPAADFRTLKGRNKMTTVKNIITGTLSTGMYNADGVESSGLTIYETGDYIQDVSNSIEYAEGIDDILVYGWLPVMTKREALHQLMFATGVSLLKSGNGKMIFTSLTNTIEKTIPDDDIYMGGTVEYLDHTNTLEVTEHSYISTSATAEEETELYKNELNIQKPYVVEFGNKPAEFSAQYDGMVCYLYNCNAAVVKGIGSIKGYPYAHEQKINVRQIGNYGDGKTVSVSDATMITAVNSEAVADRLEAYYKNAYLVKNELLYSDERNGNKYNFKNPFGELVSGFLSKISQKVSSMIKSTCEFVTNYTAPDFTTGFNHYVILSGSGTWTVPDSVLQAESPRIRAVLIGGGNGGSSGYAGEDGAAWSPSMYTITPANGGNVGTPGDPGKVYDIVIDNPASTISYSCGAGGAGGAVNSSTSTVNSGSNGGNTTLTSGSTTYSSSSGNRYDNGYVNVFSGDVYAKKVEKPLGTRINIEWGGEGGTFTFDPALHFPDSITFGKGGKGGYFTSVSGTAAWDGGQCSFDLTDRTNDFPSFFGGSTGGSTGGSARTGGCGGGAAWGSDGENGADSIKGSSKAGNGGDGADATYIPVKPNVYNARYFGYGGCGGAGGGGGGCSALYSGSISPGHGGKGGKGGKGGDGGDGCVIIYY